MRKNLLLGITLLFCCATSAQQNYELHVLDFEGQKWSALIDQKQYGGPLLYGESGMGNMETQLYSWVDDTTQLYHEFPYNYYAYCYWGGGHAISHYTSGEAGTYGDYNYQLTVFQSGVTGIKTTGGGNNGSDNFCVHYGYHDESGFSAEFVPTWMFYDGKARVIDHMYVTNTCYAINCYMSGNGLTAKIGPNDWVRIEATGYDADGDVTKTVYFYLCNGPEYIIREWTKWDLSGLGEVLMVEFNITGSSDNGHGFSQPAYFAYDDVAVRFPKGETTSIDPIGSVQTCAKRMISGQLQIERGGYIYNVDGRKTK